MLQKVATESGPDAADSALTVCRTFFNWTVAAPRHLLPANPTNGIKRVARKAEDAATDDRILTDSEIRWLWLACGKIAPQFGNIVKLLLLTGARRNEVAHMTESELDTEASLWTLPAVRSKNGKAHRIHLTTEALDALKATPRVDNEGGFVFSTNGRSPVSGFSKFTAGLRDEMAKLAEQERGEPVKVQPWHLHSLRKTFASGLARLGVSLQVAERCLNHSSGTLGGLVAVYNRHSYDEEQRAAWDAWSRHVASIVTGKATNIVPFKGRAQVAELAQ
jgi:integrase